MEIQTLNGSALLLTLSIGSALLFLIYWLYPKGVAPDTGFVRSVLRLLRFGAVAGLLILLLHPVVRFRHRNIRLPVVGLLLDDTISMTVLDNGRLRGGFLRSLNQSRPILDLGKRARVMTGLFSNRLDTLTPLEIDSMTFSGASTDLSRMLYDFQEQTAAEPVRSLILISDGRMSTGENPLYAARSCGYPIHTLVLGDSVQKPDLILEDVVANSVVYVDNPVQLNLMIRSPGFSDRVATVTLRSGQQILDQKKLRLTSEQAGHPLQLEFTPRQTGLQKLTVELSRFENEVTDENNRREIHVQVLKRRIRVALVAGRPSPDAGYINRFFSNHPDLDLETYTLRNDGSFYEGAFPSSQSLQETDVLFLADAPTRGFPRPVFRTIQQALETGVSLLWMAGPEMDLNQMKLISALLPFTEMQSAEERLVSIEQTEAGRRHPVTRIIRPGGDDASQGWHQLPSIYSGWLRLEPREGAAVLAQSETGIPLITAFHSGPVKTVALTGSGWYRLDMLMKGVGRDNQLIRSIFENSLRWLALHESVQPVQLQTDKGIVRAGEDVMIHVNVYGGLNQIAEHARVSGTVRFRQNNIQLEFETRGEGRYRALYRSFEGGEHQIAVQACYDDQVLGSDTASVMIDAFHPEYMDTRSNPGLMRSISRATGGRFGTPDSLASIVNAIQYPPFSEEKISEWNPLEALWILILLILILSTEWFIRIRNGML